MNEQNLENKPKKKAGRPKELPTTEQLFAELEVKIEPCESCGAKPATYCHYANGRTLCRKCSRPYFKRHLGKFIGGGGAVTILCALCYFFI